VGGGGWGGGARGVTDWRVGVAPRKGGIVCMQVGAGPSSRGTVGVVGWRHGRRQRTATTGSTNIGFFYQAVLYCELVVKSQSSSCYQADRLISCINTVPLSV